MELKTIKKNIRFIKKLIHSEVMQENNVIKWVYDPMLVKRLKYLESLIK